MENDVIQNISENLNINVKDIKATLNLLENGNTIPFIARYRKEVTNNLDEEQIRKISDVYNYELSLIKRKEDVLRLIDEKGMLTDEIKEAINKAKKLVEIEDIYLPFKEKKKTKGTEAIKNGLENLAKIIMSFPVEFNENKTCQKFLNENVKSNLDAIVGAKYIIAEWISENSSYRKWIRNFIWTTGNISSKLKKDATDEKQVFANYYDFSKKK